MPEKEKNISLRDKLKDLKVNRAAVLTAVVLIAALAVIISVTVATNRSKKKDSELPKNDPPKVTTQTPQSTAPTDDPTPESTKPEKPADTTGSAQVEDKLPSFILPVNGILSKKHDATVQVYSNTMKDYRVHLGVDIVTESDAPVYSAADGKISKIWEDPMMGYCIAIKHGGDCYTIYKNLSEMLPEGISEGTSVRAGQLIGSVGESAMIEVAEEPHLHFEMTVSDLSVDPLEYFDEASIESLKIDASHVE
ncbi:MAG: M23 family metallopeptidase [Clostridia bacterium]|nr:M23 family metallopeptidase [Clostridia bacterium]